MAQIGADDTGAFDSPRPDLLYQITGIGPEAAGDHVRLDIHAGVRSTQRLALADAGGGVLVALWPAELKTQATQLYDRGRASAMLAAAREQGWSAAPSPHLAFYNSRPSQRLYMSPEISTEEYVERWEGPDGRRIGQYDTGELRRELWPWLKQRGYAADPDDVVFEEFLRVLGRRPAHLRPGLRLKRWWGRHEVRGLDAHELASAIRRSVNAILGAAGEPALPPR